MSGPRHSTVLLVRCDPSNAINTTALLPPRIKTKNKTKKPNLLNDIITNEQTPNDDHLAYYLPQSSFTEGEDIIEHPIICAAAVKVFKLQSQINIYIFLKVSYP